MTDTELSPCWPQKRNDRPAKPLPPRGLASPGRAAAPDKAGWRPLLAGRPINGCERRSRRRNGRPARRPFPARQNDRIKFGTRAGPCITLNKGHRPCRSPKVPRNAGWAQKRSGRPAKRPGNALCGRPETGAERAERAGFRQRPLPSYLHNWSTKTYLPSVKRLSPRGSVPCSQAWAIPGRVGHCSGSLR